MNGWGESRTESLETAKAQALRAIGLNEAMPVDYYILRQYDEAVAAFNQVLSSNSAAQCAHLGLAAACAGLIDDAEWEVQQLLAANPEISAERILSASPFAQSANRGHLIAGLRNYPLNRPAWMPDAAWPPAGLTTNSPAAYASAAPRSSGRNNLRPLCAVRPAGRSRWCRTRRAPWSSHPTDWFQRPRWCNC